MFKPKDKMPFSFVGELNFKRYDYVLFCVGHKKSRASIKKLDKNPIYFDLNNIFKKLIINILKEKNKIF